MLLTSYGLEQISSIRLLQWCSVALRTTPPATAFRMSMGSALDAAAGGRFGQMGASPKHEGEARVPQRCHYMLWGRTQGCLGMEHKHQGGPAQDRASQYHQENIPARVQANPMTGRVGGEKQVCIQKRCTCHLTQGLKPRAKMPNGAT